MYPGLGKEPCEDRVGSGSYTLAYLYLRTLVVFTLSTVQSAFLPFITTESLAAFLQ